MIEKVMRLKVELSPAPPTSNHKTRARLTTLSEDGKILSIEEQHSAFDDPEEALLSILATTHGFTLVPDVPCVMSECEGNGCWDHEQREYVCWTCGEAWG